MIGEKTLETSNLDDWVEDFYEIYKDKDRKRTVSNMWLHLVENASKVGETIRNDQLELAFKELAHVFCWLTGFIAKCNDKDLKRNNIDRVYLLDKPLSEIVWNKYPWLCPSCGRYPCMCPIFRGKIDAKEVADRVAENRKRRGKMPSTLDEWVDMFQAIYEKAHLDLSIENICFHFLEEVGEVAREMLKLSSFEDKGKLSEEEKVKLKNIKEELENELADVFSWIASLVSKLGFISGVIMQYYSSYHKEEKLKIEKIKLSRILWNAYKSPRGDFLYCPDPYCQNRPCTCPDCF